MQMQGWPLWAVRGSTGQVYAVVGWEQYGRERGLTAVGVELGVELEGRQGVTLDGVAFTVVSPYVGRGQ